MKLTRFFADGRQRFGLAEEAGLADLSGQIGSFEELAALAMGQDHAAIQAARKTARSFKQSEVTRLIPLETNYRVFCAALNYRVHAEDVGFQVPSEPMIFFKLSESMINPDEEITSPGIVKFLDYEGELAVVIGRSGANIPEAEALRHVLGYCAMNEVSARDLQKRPGAGRPTIDWFSGKALDGIAPVGPYIVTPDEIADVDDFGLKTRLNGAVVQDVRTKDLIFTVSRLISYISQRVKLRPFDVIATGTPGGVGESFGRNLVPGDVVEVELENVSHLKNTIGSARTYGL